MLTPVLTRIAPFAKCSLVSHEHEENAPISVRQTDDHLFGNRRVNEKLPTFVRLSLLAFQVFCWAACKEVVIDRRCEKPLRPLNVLISVSD